VFRFGRADRKTRQRAAHVHVNVSTVRTHQPVAQNVGKQTAQ
jgi:hypothetical protein